MQKWIAGVVISCTAMIGCFPPVQKAVTGPVPTERAAECRTSCKALGMQLTSVVLIMNSAGCVCQVLEAAPPAETPAATPAAASAISGGAAIAATIAAAEASRSSQQHNQQPSQPMYHSPTSHH